MTIHDIRAMAAAMERHLEALRENLSLDAQAVVDWETLPALQALRKSLYRVEDVDGKSHERRLSL